MNFVACLMNRTVEGSGSAAKKLVTPLSHLNNFGVKKQWPPERSAVHRYPASSSGVEGDLPRKRTASSNDFPKPADI